MCLEKEPENDIAKKEGSISAGEDAVTPSTPTSSPKKKGRPKGSKNVKKREPKIKLVFDNSDDDKKKKRPKKKVAGKAAGSKPAEPVVVAEEKEKLMKGPFVKIAGDKETVINSSKTEDDVGKKPKSCFIDAELRAKVNPKDSYLGFSLKVIVSGCWTGFQLGNGSTVRRFHHGRDVGVCLL